MLVGLAVSRADGLVPDLAGGALYTVLVYVLVAALRPGARPWRVAAVSLAISVAVELLQLTDVPRDVVAQVPVLRLVLGTTFVATDLASAAVGALVAAGADVAAHRLTARGRRQG